MEVETEGKEFAKKRRHSGKKSFKDFRSRIKKISFKCDPVAGSVYETNPVNRSVLTQPELSLLNPPSAASVLSGFGYRSLRNITVSPRSGCE